VLSVIRAVPLRQCCLLLGLFPSDSAVCSLTQALALSELFCSTGWLSGTAGAGYLSGTVGAGWLSGVAGAGWLSGTAGVGWLSGLIPVADWLVGLADPSAGWLG